MQNRELDRSLLKALSLGPVPKLQPRTVSLHFSERKLLLVVTDLLLVNFALLVSFLLQPDHNFVADDLLDDLGFRLPWFVLLTTLWLISGMLFNLYDLKHASNLYSSVKASSLSVVMTLTVYMAVSFIILATPSNLFEASLFLGLTLIGVVSWRTFYSKVLAHPSFQSRVLVVGAGKAGSELASLFAGKDNVQGSPIGYQLLGFVDNDKSKQDAVIEGAKVLGTNLDLISLVESLIPDEIIVAITNKETIEPELFDAFMRCHELGIRLTTMPEVFERITGQIAIAHTKGFMGTIIPLTYHPMQRLYLILHRGVDLLVSLIGCLLLVTIIPFIWASNRLWSPGPLFYKQERVGKSGKHFSIVKFRSMRVDAEKFGAVWATEKDPRITKVGNFLRKTRLDEIPQFWNVLKGEMSLIGPRPERPQFVMQLEKKVPFYRLRHAVKPGLTGWAQVEYRYTSCIEDSSTKLQYDLYYIKHQSLFLDLKIVFRTINVILGLKGR
ncbi:MAG: sugar transferase [Chloroflexota bacterium]|nr:sugar transferase [Chloroflexota bacterium]